MDGPIRYGAVATVFWGVVGFLVGVVIAFRGAWVSTSPTRRTLAHEIVALEAARPPPT